MIPGVELTELLQNIGILGISIIIFLESGIPFGFIFPGDSLLVTAGVLAAAGVLNLPLLIICVFIAAILGVNAGYSVGRRYGRKLFSKDKSVLFHKDHVLRAEAFYEKHGGKAIVLARFLPIVRTFAPIVAGIGHMNYRRFMLFNIIGAVVWAVGVTLLGVWLGNSIPADTLEHYLIFVIIGVIVLSLLPAAAHFVIEGKRKRTEAETTPRK
jgi:membrane-associated protein